MGSAGSVVLIVIITGFVSGQDHVCLKAVITEDAILLKCKIDRTSLDVHFYSPDSKLIGSCSAPIPKEYAKETFVNCGHNITQYLDDETTVLRLEKSSKWVGEWTCKHGSARSSDSVTITKCMIESVTYFKENKVDLTIPFGLVIVLSVIVILLLIVWIYTLKKEKQPPYDRIPMDEVFGEVSDDQNKNQQRVGLCHTCNHDTSFSFCSCKQIFCEECSKAHHRANKEHHLQQIDQGFENRNIKYTCKECKNESAKLKICTKCRDYYCINCICTHKKQFIKLLIRSKKPVATFKKMTKIRMNHPELIYKYQLPCTNAIIAGIACLNGDCIAVIDYQNRLLNIFKKRKHCGCLNLNAEPRALTKISEKKVAISFAYEKKIKIFSISNNGGITEESSECINLKSLGKPFSISYSKEHFAVEIGEKIYAFIAIINKKGECLHKIYSEDFEFGYFTGNTLRLALDMNKEHFYTSAIGKKSIYCVDFKGNILWHLKVPSPREIHIVQTSLHKTNIIYASNKGNAVYQLLGDDNTLRDNILEGDKLPLVDITNPEYVNYNVKKKWLIVGMLNGKVNVYLFENGLEMEK